MKSQSHYNNTSKVFHMMDNHILRGNKHSSSAFTDLNVIEVNDLSKEKPIFCISDLTDYPLYFPDINSTITFDGCIIGTCHFNDISLEKVFSSKDVSINVYYEKIGSDIIKITPKIITKNQYEYTGFPIISTSSLMVSNNSSFSEDDFKEKISILGSKFYNYYFPKINEIFLTQFDFDQTQSNKAFFVHNEISYTFSLTHESINTLLTF